MNKEEIISVLRAVEHPAHEGRNIVDLGLVGNVAPEGDGVSVTLSFPRHRDPLADYLCGSVRSALVRAGFAPEQVQVGTEVRESRSEGAPKGVNALGTEELEKVSHIIGIASGKGGVGKSTVAVNLAVALARLGYRVGLADADIYGPSVPKMTGTEEETPEAFHEGDKDVILPLEKFGVKWMSVGYFVPPEQALAWRGPMACNALKQMLLQVRWGELDFLLVDMPPGTGDIHLSLVHDVPFEGALVVTTPQAVALADAEKGIALLETVQKKVFGLVENMSWFTPEAHPDERYFLFGQGGGRALAERHGLPLLGQVPLVQSIREDGDEGQPPALGTRPDSLAFLDLARTFAELFK